VPATSEEKSDELEDSFHVELEYVSDHFPKNLVKILLGDFNAKVRIFSNQQLEMLVPNFHTWYINLVVWPTASRFELSWRTTDKDYPVEYLLYSLHMV
jgi:hypothetical protein